MQPLIKIDLQKIARDSRPVVSDICFGRKKKQGDTDIEKFLGFISDKRYEENLYYFFPCNFIKAKFTKSQFYRCIC